MEDRSRSVRRSALADRRSVFFKLPYNPRLPERECGPLFSVDLGHSDIRCNCAVSDVAITSVALEIWAPKPQPMIKASVNDGGHREPASAEEIAKEVARNLPPAPSPSRNQAAPRPHPASADTKPETQGHPGPKQGLDLSVSLVGPEDPAIVVDNPSDGIAEQDITWQLVMVSTLRKST